jgi:FtsH-binding integral membrane protein
MSYQGNVPPIPNSSWAVADAQANQQSFVTRVYGWMAGGLALTALVSAFVAGSPAIMQAVFGSALIWVLFLVELGLVIGVSAAINRISAATATALFLLYAAINGVTIAGIYYVYTKESIASTFVITALTFGGVAAYGAVTKRDLTSIGSFMGMGLWGLIIASVANIWFHSPMVYWLTTYFGVFIFVGLTAYDAQKIKRIGANAALDRESSGKASILGALALYLDFINLFLLLLRIFGGGSRRS